MTELVDSLFANLCSGPGLKTLELVNFLEGVDINFSGGLDSLIPMTSQLEKLYVISDGGHNESVKSALINFIVGVADTSRYLSNLDLILPSNT